MTYISWRSVCLFVTKNDHFPLPSWAPEVQSELPARLWLLPCDDDDGDGDGGAAQSCFPLLICHSKAPFSNKLVQSCQVCGLLFLSEALNCLKSWAYCITKKNKSFWFDLFSPRLFDRNGLICSVFTGVDFHRTLNLQMRIRRLSSKNTTMSKGRSGKIEMIV